MCFLSLRETYVQQTLWTRWRTTSQFPVWFSASTFSNYSNVMFFRPTVQRSRLNCTWWTFRFLPRFPEGVWYSTPPQRCCTTVGIRDQGKSAQINSQLLRRQKTTCSHWNLKVEPLWRHERHTARFNPGATAFSRLHKWFNTKKSSRVKPTVMQMITNCSLITSMNFKLISRN